ncbi:MAG: 16S rRNA (cytosine(1402)-N(4))-methyltransferase RsmH, partial [Eubacteriaceae bacterium]|nr:16S rRNA (cytosine(1402)-N(4))-methyltransferase RsmH [Eubacteriaceae bacterium]
MAHIPVMYEECLEGLAIKPDGTYLDMTVGGFGHGRGICEKLSEKGTYVGFDLDIEALKRAEENSEGLRCRRILIHDNFHNFRARLDSEGIGSADGILIDLGVSSFQIDEAERGFSFMREGPLDMRMDQSAKISAYDIVNGYSREALSEIIKKYGEERYSGSIASGIVKAREDSPIRTTTELTQIVEQSVPAKYRRQAGKNVSTRTFQAIRIEVNGELSGLRESLLSMVDSLGPGGRLCVMSFHSLEDRTVKEVFKEKAQGCTCPKDFPVCVCG